MTTTVRTTAHRAPMDQQRKTALVAGVLYLVTFISIPALLLISPVLSNPDYITGAGSDTQVILGCLLDVVTALACIGTAVVLFPVVKRQNEALALGFVTARVFEAAVIVIGVVSLLAVVTLRQDTAGADTTALAATGQALVAVRDWTFLLGPGIMPAFNALLLGTLLYRSRLVPRIMPLLGLIGAPLLLASSTATLFGVNEQVSVFSFITTLPIAVWELSLGIYLVVRGFRPLTTATAPAGHPAA